VKTVKSGELGRIYLIFQVYLFQIFLAKFQIFEPSDDFHKKEKKTLCSICMFIEVETFMDMFINMRVLHSEFYFGLLFGCLHDLVGIIIVF
jgi:hypothetical protein